MTRPRRFILVDGSIRGYGGHHLEYARVVLEVAAGRGFEPTLVAHRDFDAAAVPWRTHSLFERDYWGRGSLEEPTLPETPRRPPARRLLALLEDRPGLRTAVGWARSMHRRLDGRSRQAVYERTFGAALRQLEPRAADLVFVPTLSEWDLAGALRAVAATPGAAMIHFLLRREPSSEGVRAVRRALRATRPDAVQLHSDTDELAAHLAHGLRHPIEPLPIPVGSAFRASSPRRRSGPLTVAYLGDARAERGFGLLQHVVADVRSAGLPADEVRFVVQVPVEGPGSAEAALAAEGTQVVRGAQTSEEFAELLLSADLLLLPYEAAAYRRRSSGLLAEAGCAGVPAIVPGDTWLARQLILRSGPACKDLIFQETGELGARVVSVLDRIEFFRQAAEAASASWRLDHNPERLIGMLDGAAS